MATIAYVLVLSGALVAVYGHFSGAYRAGQRSTSGYLQGRALVRAGLVMVAIGIGFGLITRWLGGTVPGP